MKYLIGGIVLAVAFLPVFLALRWRRRSRRQNYPEVSRGRGKGWLQWTAIWLLQHLPGNIRNSEAFTGQAERAASRLYPGGNKQLFCRRYQIHKMMLLYGGLLAAVIFLVICGILERPPDLENYLVVREDVRGTERTVNLKASIENSDDTQIIALTVAPRRYTEKEWQKLLNDIKAYIDICLPGENESLQLVSQSLCFPDTYPGENITIEWQPEDYNLIHQDGALGDLTMYQLPIQTAVTAVIRYGNYEESYRKNIKIIQPVSTEAERLHDRLAAAVEAADRQNAEQLQFELPQEIDGRRIVWSYDWSSALPGLAVLLTIGLICLMLYPERRLKRQLEERNLQLLYDYPGFVHRMVLMLGAGMTPRRSLEQLLRDYEKAGIEARKNNYLYKELKYTSLQMQAGVPEVQAYMDFGRRTESSQYMKFCQLLVQLIRRGSKGMQEMMTAEACEAQKQRRDMARRLGETAGTKLLLPMMMLLVVVLFIVMVPAFLSM